MKRFMPVALLMVLLAGIGAAQTSMTPAMQNAPSRKSSLAEYAGSWVSVFRGHTWFSIRLIKQGTQLTGTVQMPAEFTFDNSGDLKSVSDDRSTYPLENVTLETDYLLLKATNTRTRQTDSYIMQLTSANTAELKMDSVPMSPEMPQPKPWKLSRVGPTAVAPVH